ncbi:helix-turn-helix domain-containing protein [Actinocrispum wychmicini]|uniref:nSTAND1 domain-containing NTPase n=1 Tax=Actinocrispum wychmicini TaxID=1213861 RepID=UPI001049893A|nr:helix-turn-helix domain-containing protein [Actinocrispum wychmicini]
MESNNHQALDPAQISTKAQFGKALTVIREQAGLTVRDVARQLGIPNATVGGYFAGKTLPHPGMTRVVAGILTTCGVDDEVLVEGLIAAVMRVRRSPGRPAAATTVPFRGLAWFDREHAEWFFGREDLIQRLVGRVAEDGGHRPILVIGPSGVGKSSALRAGLAPALRGAAVVVTNPGAQPLSALVDAVAEFGETHRSDRVLIVDQFEELFTTRDNGAVHKQFLDQILDLSRHHTVVAGLRADFYGELARYGEFVTSLEKATVVGPMTSEQLRSAIVEPAKKAGVDLEPGLVELLIQEVSPDNDEGRLPLLSHALRETWQRHSRNRITIADYRATGGLQRAVAQSADAVFASLNDVQQQIARRLFLRLVHIDVRGADTRRKVSHLELIDGRDDAEQSEVLDRFVDQRLVMADADGVMITHEALIQAWPTLRAWIDADRVGLRTHRQLSTAAESWQDSSHDPATLLRGGPLDTASAWAEDHDTDMNSLERQFLAASSQLQKDERDAQRRRVNRLRSLVAVLVVLILLSATLVVVLQRQRADAQHDRDLAASRDLATRSRLLRGTDRAVAAQLALTAYRIAPTPEARASLMDISTEPAVTRLVGVDEVLQGAAVTASGRLLAAAGTDKNIRLWDITDRARPHQVGPPLSGPTDTVFTVAFSPDNQLLAASGADTAIRLWNVADPASPRLVGTLRHAQHTVYSLAFSADGRLLAAGDADNTVRLWDVRDAALISTVTGPTGYVQSVALSGHILAAGSADHTVRLWDVSDPAHAVALGAPLNGPHGTVFAVALAADGQTLAAGSSDKSVYLWHLTDMHNPVQDPKPLATATGWVNTLAFSPRGDQLAAGSSDNQVRVWDLAAHKVVQTLPHPGPVTAAGFLDGDRTVFTAAADGTARLWSLPGGAITDPSNSVFGVAYPDHGSLLAVSSGRADDSVELWDTADREHPVPVGAPLTSPGQPFSGAVTLDRVGRTLITGSRDGSVQLWNITQPANPLLVTTLPGDGALVESFALSPDNRVLAVAGDDHAVRRWDIGDLNNVTALPTLTGPKNYVYNVAFSPDGRTLAAASADTTVWLWDVHDPALATPLQVLDGFHGYVYGVAFSPRGPVLAAGSADKTVRMWNMADPAHPAEVGPPITGPSSYVYGIAISPDGRTLAIGSTDNSVRLVDITDPTAPVDLATLTGSTEAVFTVSFTPDGSGLVAGTAERRVRFWTVDPEQVATRVCTSMGSGLTQAEWRRYVPDRPYAPPC